MDQKIIRSYKTKGIKELQAFIKPGTSHYILQYEGGGEVPAELSGIYTSISLVDQAVFTYIHSDKETKKEVKSTKVED